MSIPANIIIAWSGAINEIPDGWVLCNGTNGTPDLRNRFIVGAGNLYDVNSTGGFANATLVSHNHTASLTTEGNHTHNLNVFDNFAGAGTFRGTNDRAADRTVTTSTGGAHTHNFVIDNTGENETNANLPPYYALAFIMKEAD